MARVGRVQLFNPNKMSLARARALQILTEYADDMVCVLTICSFCHRPRCRSTSVRSNIIRFLWKRVHNTANWLRAPSVVIIGVARRSCCVSSVACMFTASLGSASPGSLENRYGVWSRCWSGSWSRDDVRYVNDKCNQMHYVQCRNSNTNT